MLTTESDFRMNLIIFMDLSLHVLGEIKRKVAWALESLLASERLVPPTVLAWLSGKLKVCG